MWEEGKVFTRCLEIESNGNFTVSHNETFIVRRWCETPIVLEINSSSHFETCLKMRKSLETIKKVTLRRNSE